MKRLLKVMAVLLAVLAALAGVAVLYLDRAGIPRYTPAKVELRVEVTPERVERGRKTAQMLCVGCHLDNETGALSGLRMRDLPPQFGVAYAANITRDPETGIGGWTDGELAYLLRTGVTRDGRYTPPWMVKLPLVSDEDLADVIAFLRSDDPLVQPVKRPSQPSEPSLLTKFLCRVAFKPLPWPKAPIAAPDPGDRVAYGRYLVQGRGQCFGCHSADFAKMDDLVPENSAGYLGGGNAMPDLTGRVVLTSNITPDEETGIGRWSEDEFVRALRHGVRPDRSVLLYPMVPYPELSDDEARAIHAYLRTVPKIRNVVARPAAAAVATSDAGKAAYYRYACHSCHGDTGTLLYDLRKGVGNYATDAELIAYIRNPERAKPGIKMPTWDGVIAEEDYAPLAAYVRSLAGPRSGG
jgi:mono/diheme cytochrome c family protein